MLQFYEIVDFRSWQRVSKVLNEKKYFLRKGNWIKTVYDTEKW